MFQVVVSRRAKKSLEKLPSFYKRKVLELLLLLRENPVPADYYDIRKLRGHVDTYRARIGDIRVIYEILWGDRRINILLVERREKAYRGL